MHELEPAAPDPEWPRYSTRSFPPYRFVPGRSPHPSRDPRGHSYGRAEHSPPALPPDRWAESESYLFGIDLHNFAYWWECHEELEQLWNAVGHATPQGQFLQGIIQVSAANLKYFMGSAVHARLAEEGLARLHGLPDRFMGADVPAFVTAVRAWHGGHATRPALIRLQQA